MLLSYILKIIVSEKVTTDFIRFQGRFYVLLKWWCLQNFGICKNLQHLVHVKSLKLTKSSHAYYVCGSDISKHVSKHVAKNMHRQDLLCSKAEHSNTLKNIKGLKFTLKLPTYREQLYPSLLSGLRAPSNYSVIPSFQNSLYCSISNLLKCKCDELHKILLLFLNLKSDIVSRN